MSSDKSSEVHTTDGGITGEQPQYIMPVVYVAPSCGDECNTIRFERPCVACWRMEDIRFKFGSSFIKPDARDELQGLHELKSKHRGAPLSIFGHADPIGDDVLNKKLSGRRAQAVYALLTRNTDLWEELYKSSYGSDKWDTDEIQTMLSTLGYYSGPINGYKDEPTRQAAMAFQRDHDLEDDGVVGKNTRGKLFLAYMETICVDKDDKPFSLDPKKEFLAKGEDGKGKGDYQGCGEFNPDMLFSEIEHDRYKKPALKSERNKENSVNRRVVGLLFKPGCNVDPNNWSCPRASEGISGCKTRFWSDGEKRRRTRYHDDRREYDEEKKRGWGTFACRFYDRIVTISPCEQKPPPVKPIEKYDCIRVITAPLTFLQYNTALLPKKIAGIFTGYKGEVSRETAIRKFIEQIRAEPPDIVGLSECWEDEIREHFKEMLLDIYPYTHEGPLAGSIVSQSGGLLLLSKYEIIARDSTTYRHCTGEDCLTSKGVLHAQIKVGGHPTNYDVFLTHMQSCPTEITISSEESCWDNLRLHQVLHLRFFVQAYSNPNRPALLMGDFNQDGRNEVMLDSLLQRLGFPEDLWPTTGPANDPGITHDDDSSFEKDSVRGDINDPSRGKDGKRLDYFFSWRKLNLMRPTYTNTRVVRWESIPGRDLSDHYGLTTQQTEICEVNVDVTQQIKSVMVSLKAFHCLVETGGSFPCISPAFEQDEVEFAFYVYAATGQSHEFKTDLIEDIDAGTYYEFESPLTMTFKDPGDGLFIEVIGWEVDTAPLIGETGRVTLGPKKISIDRRELLLHKGRSVLRVPPLLKGDQGEYAVVFEIITTV